jgi:tripartite ATP-independent transporter DctP family solute receptor
MKKLLAVLLLGSLCLTGLFAAGGKQGGSADGVKVFKFAANQPTEVTTPTMALFLDEIEKNSGGQIKVERYLNGELFDNAEDLLAGIQSNSVQGGIEGDMCLSWASPEWISWTSVPFCFQNNEQFFKFFMGSRGKEIQEKLEKNHNIHFMDSAIGARGPRMLTANKPIRSPADMEGLKFRVPNVIGTVASWEAMGAKVIGVPWSELFTSLQNGLVDAEENPYAQLESGAFYQVQKYIMKTSHQIGPQFFHINYDFWKDLSPELQKVFNDANKKAFDLFNSLTEKDEARLEQKFRDSGNIIIPTSEIDIEGFKKIIREKILTNTELTSKWAPGGWDYIQSLL